MGSDLKPEYGPERKVNAVPRRLADTTKARQMIGFEAAVSLEDGLAAVWWRGGTRIAPPKRPLVPDARRMIPIAKPWLGRGRGRGGPARDSLRLGHAGARKWRLSNGNSRRVWVRPMPVRSPIARRRCTWHCCAVGVRAGDEVITVSHSFIATANSIRYCGAVPVFVDIEPSTFNMDPALIEAAISPRTRAILCVHQMGMPCDLAAILEVARRHGLPVVEDAACAIGSETAVERPVGEDRQAAWGYRLFLLPPAQD